jgi:hypothetical protein
MDVHLLHVNPHQKTPITSAKTTNKEPSKWWLHSSNNQILKWIYKVYFHSVYLFCYFHRTHPGLQTLFFPAHIKAVHRCNFTKDKATIPGKLPLAPKTGLRVGRDCNVSTSPT